MRKLRNWFQVERQRGLTQIKFAEEIGCSQSYVCQLLSGQKQPSLEVKFAIQAATKGRIAADDWPA